jgi:hypothetical protein
MVATGMSRKRKPPKQWNGGTEPVPVRIRGVVYPSISAAAREFKVKPSSICTALARGRIDFVGLGRGTHGKQKPPIEPVEMRIGSKTHASTRAAAKALGIPRCRIQKLRRAMKELRDTEGHMR